MFKRLRQFIFKWWNEESLFSYEEEIKFLRAENEKKNTLITELQKEKNTLHLDLDRERSPQYLSERALHAIMRRKIQWYDFEELKGTRKKDYVSSAQALLQNEVLQNEVAGVISDLVEMIVETKGSSENKEYQRYAILGIQTLMEHLENII